MRCSPASRVLPNLVIDPPSFLNENSRFRRIKRYCLWMRFFKRFYFSLFVIRNIEYIYFYFVLYEYTFYLETLIKISLESINYYFNFHLYSIKFYKIFNLFLKKFHCLDMKQFVLKCNRDLIYFIWQWNETLKIFSNANNIISNYKIIKVIKNILKLYYLNFTDILFISISKHGTTLEWFLRIDSIPSVPFTNLKIK